MKKWLFRFGWMAVGVGALYATAALAGVVSGGSLDPPGPVGSTMKSLDDIPPSWHRILAADDGFDACHSSRFQCVMGDAAVLDRETGLVWEQAPSTALQHWYSAIRYCQQTQIAGRYGWRSPSVEELRSLLDETGLLPAGVFNVQTSEYYWSASVDPASNNFGPVIRFDTVGGGFAASLRTDFVQLHAWCVRGVNAGSEYQGDPPP
jgi:hypothetical protein